MCSSGRRRLTRFLLARACKMSWAPQPCIDTACIHAGMQAYLAHPCQEHGIV